MKSQRKLSMINAIPLSQDLNPFYILIQMFGSNKKVGSRGRLFLMFIKIKFQPYSFRNM
jgi:hypothetical protein